MKVIEKLPPRTKPGSGCSSISTRPVAARSPPGLHRPGRSAHHETGNVTGLVLNRAAVAFRSRSAAHYRAHPTSVARAPTERRDRLFQRFGSKVRRNSPATKDWVRCHRLDGNFCARLVKGATSFRLAAWLPLTGSGLTFAVGLRSDRQIRARLCRLDYTRAQEGASLTQARCSPSDNSDPTPWAE